VGFGGILRLNQLTNQSGVGKFQVKFMRWHNESPLSKLSDGSGNTQLPVHHGSYSAVDLDFTQG
jgi:hypothetical protein